MTAGSEFEEMDLDDADLTLPPLMPPAPQTSAGLPVGLGSGPQTPRGGDADDDGDDLIPELGEAPPAAFKSKSSSRVAANAAVPADSRSANRPVASADAQAPAVDSSEQQGDKKKDGCMIQ